MRSTSSATSATWAEQRALAAEQHEASSRVTTGQTSLWSAPSSDNSGTESPTEFLTVASSTCRSDEQGCSSSEPALTEILEPPQDVPPRYSLSARAAEGILRRAAKRGRTLPPHLEEALATVAATTATRSTGGGHSSLSGLGSGGADDNDAQAGRLVTVAPDVAYALADGSGTRPGSGRDAQDTLIAETVRSHPRPGSNSNGNLVAAPLSHGSNPNSYAAGRRREDDGIPINSPQTGVRRLTPTECERLQGLPDGWTAPEELGGPGTYRRGRNRKAESGEEHEGWVCIDGVADGKRYAALGDAVTATVAHWLGDRILHG